MTTCPDPTATPSTTFSGSLAHRMRRGDDDVAADRPAARTLRPMGDVDVATVGDQLDAGWETAVPDPPSVIVDLQDVTFIDSVGLGAIVELRTRMNAVGGGVQLRGAPPDLVRILRLSGLDELFPDADTPA